MPAPAPDHGETHDALLTRVARACGTPCYVYRLEGIRRRIRRVREAFGGRFRISFAVKANPNAELLRRLETDVDGVDVSSGGEVELALECGYRPERLSFSGPAKRPEELSRAVEVGVGDLVCESIGELESLDQLAGARSMTRSVLLRINPSRLPKKFGVAMSGRPSQFGIDEEDMPETLRRLESLPGLQLDGFHIYSATNSLNVDAIDENFATMIELFSRFSAHAGVRPRRLIFGAGFGIPYTINDTPLDLDALATKINPRIDAMRQVPALADAECVLEIGRYLTGPEGFLLTSVVGEKLSRGTEIRLCDAGFNCHLAAFGMMGTVIRRNWPIWKVGAGDDEPRQEYLLTGPLCTTIDVMATGIELPRVRCGDVLAIGSSGAYGFSASPTRFISHPPPKEIMVIGEGDNEHLLDVSSLGAGGPAGEDGDVDAPSQPGAATTASACDTSASDAVS